MSSVSPRLNSARSRSYAYSASEPDAGVREIVSSCYCDFPKSTAAVILQSNKGAHRRGGRWRKHRRDNVDDMLAFGGAERRERCFPYPDRLQRRSRCLVNPIQIETPLKKRRDEFLIFLKSEFGLRRSDEDAINPFLLSWSLKHIRRQHFRFDGTQVYDVEGVFQERHERTEDVVVLSHRLHGIFFRTDVAVLRLALHFVFALFDVKSNGLRDGFPGDLWPATDAVQTTIQPALLRPASW
jgi:hypothetical protein